MNIRAIKNEKDLEEIMPSVKRFADAIRLKCLDCSAYDHAEVRKCVAYKCPLYNFRDGHRPKLKD